MMQESPSGLAKDVWAQGAITCVGKWLGQLRKGACS